MFVRISATPAASEDDQALAYFLPGHPLQPRLHRWCSAVTCLIGWPLVGFMVGSVTGDPTAWHEDKQVVKLCTRLTWVLLAPGAIGVLLQGPIWLLGQSGTIDADTAVADLGVLKIALGWPLRSRRS